MEVLNNFSPEALSSHVYTMDIPKVDATLRVIQEDFELPDCKLILLDKAMSKVGPRLARKEQVYSTTLSGILNIATDPSTHVRNCYCFFVHK